MVARKLGMVARKLGMRASGKCVFEKSLQLIGTLASVTSGPKIQM